MPRRYRRRSSRRRGGSVGALVALLLLALLLLVVVVNGANLPALSSINLPRLNLPPLPDVTIPITGLPEINLPDIGIQVRQQPGDAPADPGPSGTVAWGQRTKTSGCVLQGSLPDPGCTPGDVLPNATIDQICEPGYASTVNNVPQSRIDDVYRAYGISNPPSGQYRVDHLVSLSLGGSNDISNLWPQPLAGSLGANEKDRAASYLRERVCSGQMSLSDAQFQLATNWVDVYNRMPK